MENITEETDKSNFQVNCRNFTSVSEQLIVNNIEMGWQTKASYSVLNGVFGKNGGQVMDPEETDGKQNWQNTQCKKKIIGGCNYILYIGNEQSLEIG